MTDTAQAEDIARLSAIVAEQRARLDEQPDIGLPAYADALMDLAARLAEAGRADEALAHARDGVGHYRQLFDTDSATFGVHLASALNNLSNRLSDTGCDDEARLVGDEAFALARSAVADKPNEARFVLVSTLMNQSGRSWRAGDSARAIAEMAGAVDLFRDGGEALMPFLGVMVDALHRNGMALTEAGRWDEAVAVRRMTADVFPADNIPAPVHHLLALTLQQAAYAKSRDGAPGAALPLVEEAAELARGLSAHGPEQYRLFLAQSLANLASRQHEAHADEQALEAAVEAVNVFQEVAHSNPGDAIAPLMSTLETFAAILTSLGHTDQARAILAQREQLLDVLEQVKGGA